MDDINPFTKKPRPKTPFAGTSTNPNSRHLKGKACPRCRSFEALQVRVEVDVYLGDNSLDFIRESINWTNDSKTTCTRCGYFDSFQGFEYDDTDPKSKEKRCSWGTCEDEAVALLTSNDEAFRRAPVCLAHFVHVTKLGDRAFSVEPAPAHGWGEIAQTLDDLNKPRITLTVSRSR